MNQKNENNITFFAQISILVKNHHTNLVCFSLQIEILPCFFNTTKTTKHGKQAQSVVCSIIRSADLSAFEKRQNLKIEPKVVTLCKLRNRLIISLKMDVILRIHHSSKNCVPVFISIIHSSPFLNHKNGDVHNFLHKKYQFCQNFFLAGLHTSSWSSGENIQLRMQGSCVRSSLETYRIKVRFELMNPGVAGRCLDRQKK